MGEILFESGVKHHSHRNKISEYFPLNIIIPLYHLFTCGNTISDNPAAAPLPPFTYMPLRLSHNVVSSTPRHDRNWNSQRQW
jgi:hypothetical protein